jgi:hypothetical protein
LKIKRKREYSVRDSLFLGEIFWNFFEKYWIQTFVFWGEISHCYQKKNIVPNSMTFWKKKLPKSRNFSKTIARFLYVVQVSSQKYGPKGTLSSKQYVRMLFFLPYFVNSQNLAKLAYWWSPSENWKIKHWMGYLEGKLIY